MYNPKLKNMDVKDFIEEYGKEWKNYCEIIIDKNGKIYLARPSHQQFLIYYMSVIEGITGKEVIDKIPINFSPLHIIVDRYKLVSVWYEGGIGYSGVRLNRKIMTTIKKLKIAKLLSKDFSIYETNEYEVYLKRGGKKW